MAHRIPTFASFSCCLLFALSLLGCGTSLTLESLHALRPKAYAGRICGVPQGAPPNTHFFAINAATNKFVTDRNPEALKQFMSVADSVHEVSAWAPLSSAKTVPTAMGVTCPAREGIPSDLKAKLDKIVAAAACTTTVNKKPDPRYTGQTWSEGRNTSAGVELKLVGAALTWALQEADAPDPRIPVPANNAKMPPRPPMELRPLATAIETPLGLEDPRVQFGSGAVAGGMIGAVPFGPMGADVAIELRLLPKGTYWARVGKACGEIVVGTGQIILGCGGMSAGVGMTSTGGGAPAGVLVISGSYAIAVNGCATAGHGASDLGQLLREGDVPSGSSAPTQSDVVLKAKPVQQRAPQPAVAETQRTFKPTPPTPAETTTKTLYKSTGKTVTKRGDTTTTTTPRGTGKPVTTQTTAPVNNSANSGTTTVYVSKNPAEQVQYVGITNDFARRAAEQLRSRKIPVERLMTGLSRSDARAVEQALIEIHGLEKSGGTLLNKINSIAKTNPAYAQLLQKGYDLLKSIGYK